MSEMVERVARAAYFAGEGISDAFNPIHDAHWAHWWKEDRKEHEAVARAAIEAMREPTDAMIDAPDGFDCDTVNVRRSVWVSMIDEALK